MLFNSVLFFAIWEYKNGLAKHSLSLCYVFQLYCAKLYAMLCRLLDAKVFLIHPNRVFRMAQHFYHISNYVSEYWACSGTMCCLLLLALLASFYFELSHRITTHTHTHTNAQLHPSTKIRVHAFTTPISFYTHFFFFLLSLSCTRTSFIPLTQHTSSDFSFI